MAPKVSIVMAYHNRFPQLKRTLLTIQDFAEGFGHLEHLEVIIVDDGSVPEHRVESLVDQFPMKIVIDRVEPEQKNWTNPCVPYNRGFRLVTGDITIFQNPECLYVGNIVGHALTHLRDGEYYSYACYSIDKHLTAKLSELDESPSGYAGRVLRMISPLKPIPMWWDGVTAWYNHSGIRPVFFHFVGAIKTKDLRELNGFDERYADGYGFDDNEILARMLFKGMSKTIIDDVVCVHQFHESLEARPPNVRELYHRNERRYGDITMKEHSPRVPDGHGIV